ncbi:hypothetical protein [Sphingorhabdus contaminans]|uniref:Uncharacterized protein n=1 Tax=Sphingorhabdus contaminans TaxID=1343899 RepID=A0A553WHG2_9SPHN|nr:hypothetical protein [Sphingorhabdus contaminans]TSB04139.1 hypothetical protein FOM92_01495 [Sphingorhabdus contaminans]
MKQVQGVGYFKAELIPPHPTGEGRFDTICLALAGGSCRFFRQKKKEKEGKKQVEMHPASGSSFFFLFFLPDNPLALRFGHT